MEGWGGVEIVINTGESVGYNLGPPCGIPPCVQFLVT